jgi:hypothetical protein
MWKEKDLEQIRGTSIYNDVVKMKSTFVRSYEEVSKSHADISLDLYLWARATTQSRAYALISPTSFSAEKDVVVSLLPYIALANHNDVKFSEVGLGNGISSPKTSYCIRALQKYYPNEVIYITYGHLSFQQRVICFGWIDRDITPFSFSISYMQISQQGSILDLEVKSRIRDHSAAVDKSMANYNQKDVMDAIRKIEKLWGVDRSEATSILVRQLETELEQIRSHSQALDHKLCFNGRYYYHPNGSEESDVMYIYRVELNALLALLYDTRDVLLSKNKS